MDIVHKFPHYGSINRIDNVPDVSQWKEVRLRTNPKISGRLNIVFFSRIAKMKNLLFLLQVLRRIDFEVYVSIYGPAEDADYYDLCIHAVSELPTNIKVSFCGPLVPSDVYEVLKEYDLFILLTLGENFGQAIWEALASSLPVLISDRTPWKDLETKGVGWDLPLEQPDLIEQAIEKVFLMDDVEHKNIRTRSREFALEYVRKSEAHESMLRLYSIG